SEPADPAEQVSRVAALSLLSGAERRVAALAARGHTNREISRRLCITVSTVEQHLTRTFRKLGVKTRADLPEEIVLDMAVAG
ncbi:helix-turn-helix transcriptional regulator, partial [Micromonospora sp. NPDC049799]